MKNSTKFTKGGGVQAAGILRAMPRKFARRLPKTMSFTLSFPTLNRN